MLGVRIDLCPYGSEYSGLCSSDIKTRKFDISLFFHSKQNGKFHRCAIVSRQTINLMVKLPNVIASDANFGYVVIPLYDWNKFLNFPNIFTADSNQSDLESSRTFFESDV